MLFVFECYVQPRPMVSGFANCCVKWTCAGDEPHAAHRADPRVQDLSRCRLLQWADNDTGNGARRKRVYCCVGQVGMFAILVAVGRQTPLETRQMNADKDAVTG